MKLKIEDEPLLQLLTRANEDSAVENLQWPNMRFVYCPEYVLSNIVRECCSIESKCIFSIDTTYNIGPFYVTPSTFQMEDVKHEASGSERAHFPGPAMFHVRRTARDFIYFSSTLCEINPNFSKVKFIGCDRDDAQRNFLNPLRTPAPLYCTKHVQDDISRKLVDLKLDSAPYLQDVFGSVHNETLGLIDCDARVFRSRLLELEKRWDPRFSKYFKSYIEEDMRVGMLAPLMKMLNIDRFYNNASESTNAKYKLKAHAYVAAERGLLPNQNLNLSFTEAVDVYKALLEEHRIDLAMSASGNGSYQLKGKKAKAVKSKNWDDLCKSEKIKKLAKIDNFYNSQKM